MVTGSCLIPWVSLDSQMKENSFKPYQLLILLYKPGSDTKAYGCSQQQKRRHHVWSVGSEQTIH